MKVDYCAYIKSKEWYAKHKDWLLGSGYRCSMFPWVKCGKGYPYRIHHKAYDNVGKETLWKDVIVLCPFAHDFIIHGILSGFKSAGKQKKKYPNKAQRLVHLWCSIPVWGKTLIIAATIYAIAYFILC